MLCSQLFSLWMKSYGVTIQMKAFTWGYMYQLLQFLQTYFIKMSIVIKQLRDHVALDSAV